MTTKINKMEGDLNFKAVLLCLFHNNSDSNCVWLYQLWQPESLFINSHHICERLKLYHHPLGRGIHVRYMQNNSKKFENV